MNSDNWNRINEIFDAASRLEPESRAEFVKSACGDDAELLAEVESLLKYADGSNFLDDSAVSKVVSAILSSENDEKRSPTQLQRTKTRDQIKITKSDESINFVAGTVLAERYRILGLLGTGGMGEVYKAEDLTLDQTVALKFLPASLAKNKDALKRFRAEVRTARQVSHENVCRVFDIGEVDGRQFLSMEFIDGDDLSQLLRRIGRLPSDKAVEITRQICMGLHAIHKAGILHRDLKPANIIIDSKGRARITDFGIAGFEADVQGVEARAGTPAYMSPEQIAGKNITQRSDIYALGLLIYKIFTGKQAIQAASFDEFLSFHETTSPTDPTEFVENLDPAIDELIRNCLAKDPADRPGSVLQVAAALPGGNPIQVALEAGETPSPEMVAASPKKGVLKLPVAVSLLVAFFGLFAAALYLASQYQYHAFTPLQKSPEVLRERAKNILSSAGYSEAPNDSVDSFGYEDYFVRFARKNDDRSVYDFEKLRSGQPFVVYFWYRQSADRLMPFSIIRNVVTEFDPPLNDPASEYVKLDTRGRLVKLVAVPPQIKPQMTSGETSWEALFDQAGLSLDRFSEAQVQVSPPVYADQQGAWQGTLADFDDIPTRIEAASANGKPVYFEVFTPWQDERIKNDRPRESALQIREIVLFLFNFLAFFGAIVISYMNLKAGRGDLNGAAKLSVFFFVLILIHRLISYDYDSLLNHWLTVFFIICGQTVILFLLYVAIEPFVRRWWTEILISWNRLLAGDFTNPLIGRDILVGGVLGCVLVLSEYFGGFLRDFIASRPSTIISFQTGTLNGTQGVATTLLLSVLIAIIRALLILMMSVILYLVFKRKWLATLGVGLFAVGMFGFQQIPSRGWLYIVFLLFVYVPVVFLFLRFGLVTIITSLACYEILNIAITFDASRFYFSNTIIVAAIGLSIALYAFYISIGDQKVFEGSILKE
ncbi:MAG: protein kinase [Pyrinomonadaceae bacterium]|nr:protein kinase [Pyrinomonadaceae bacterium]